jgi:xanthosine utilization system XapX-like protein
MRRNEIAEGVLRVASLAGIWGLIGEKLVFHGRRVVARCNSVVVCESTGHIVLRQAARHTEMSMTRAQCNEETRRHITTTIPESLGTLGYPVAEWTRYIG